MIFPSGCRHEREKTQFAILKRKSKIKRRLHTAQCTKTRDTETQRKLAMRFKSTANGWRQVKCKQLPIIIMKMYGKELKILKEMKIYADAYNHPAFFSPLRLNCACAQMKSFARKSHLNWLKVITIENPAEIQYRKRLRVFCVYCAMQKKNSFPF